MKAGVVIKLPDGRIGTLCYSNLDGEGGVWGEHDFSHIPIGFNDFWPEPEFLLREPFPGARWRCVGTKYEVLRRSER